MKAILLILMFLFATDSLGADRCVAYVKDVRIEHTRYFGLQFPYWYGVAQLSVESACRAGVTAFDAGQGIAQFMPKTSQYVQSLMGEALDPYNPKHAIRMQAFYMNRIHTKENWSDRLWISYQIYNGGAKTLHLEYVRAGLVDHELMQMFCERRSNFCEINYSYSQKIDKGSQPYRRGPDGMRYW